MKTTNETEIQVIKTILQNTKIKVDEINTKQNEILNKIESQYITRIEFYNVKEDVDGIKLILSRLAWTVVLIVITAVIGLVVKTGITV